MCEATARARLKKCCRVLHKTRDAYGVPGYYVSDYYNVIVYGMPTNYLVTMHFHPMTYHFFVDRNAERESNGIPGIYPDENLYALSCLIQWIFRSRIRDGEKIEVYIPNLRMRSLLIDWLENRA